MYIRKVLFALFYVLLLFSFEKISGQETYNTIRSHYEDLDKNNEYALPYVNRYIQKAKQEKNNTELVQGYRDRAYYSANRALKIKYADSAVITAKKTDDDNLISTTYLLKGSLYYFYYKNYPLALEEYLKAFEYSKKGKDDYLTHKIVYQMGLVKNYLGYYDEALEHFNQCISYFEPKTKEKDHPNQIYNDSKGYINSLHQAVVCWQRKNNYKKADSLTNIGLNFTDASKDFPLEKAYFLKSSGISDYFQRNHAAAEQNFNKALPVLMKNDDAYWISISEFYKGKIFWDTGNKDLAVKQFQKVDSTFKKREFFFPELQENYELLISYFQQKNDHEKELTYTKSLAEVNRILMKDFPKLSSKIHKGYDSRLLAEVKEKLEHRSKWSMGIIVLLISAVALLFFLVWKYYQNGKRIKYNYSLLEKRLQLQSSESAYFIYEDISAKGKTVISEDIFSDLQNKLSAFESDTEFTDKEMSLYQLSKKLGTNTKYLSQYINDTKGMNFSKYLSILRIKYITKQMYENPEFLKMSIQALADKCGFGSRQSFSDLFYEINKIRPADFLRQRKKEIEKSEPVFN
ncbi:MAG: helix-turn-helix domain-containing protein [Bergeyella sp.]